MKNSEIKIILKNEKQASKSFDEYNTVAKIHTLTNQGVDCVCEEMLSGHIKINGTEQFSTFDEMMSCMGSDVKIETEEV